MLVGMLPGSAEPTVTPFSAPVDDLGDEGDGAHGCHGVDRLVGGRGHSIEAAVVPAEEVEDVEADVPVGDARKGELEGVDVGLPAADAMEDDARREHRVQEPKKAMTHRSGSLDREWNKFRTNKQTNKKRRMETPALFSLVERGWSKTVQEEERVSMG